MRIQIYLNKNLGLKRFRVVSVFFISSKYEMELEEQWIGFTPHSCKH